MRSHSLVHPHVHGRITTCGQKVRAQAELFYHVEVVGASVLGARSQSVLVHIATKYLVSYLFIFSLHFSILFFFW